eukprot:CAMPEP_0171215012 /NCGR_PEP_ID=MMETSP0790-20130122/31450_1 /TAXON_ID=2925 /ORGANISM="Alexandrium catenella, Strain OF101" /LENGTH=131 /DNA_ID=CAMNT_0011680757 /DNA_START=46 /DNA_END=438 /DNA_ORIENTATION=-
MPFRSPESYASAHGVREDGLLPLVALAPCLEEALGDLGLEEAAERRRLAALLVEEYALRAEAAPIGLGALSRLLHAAASRSEEWASVAKRRKVAATESAEAHGGRGREEAEGAAAAAARREEPEGAEGAQE